MKRRLLWIGVALVSGAGAGVLAKLAHGPGWWELGRLMDTNGVWVLFVSLWGAFARRPLDAVYRSAAFALAMTAWYYAWSQLVLGYPWAPITVVWIVLSVTAVPAVAVVVQWAVRSRRIWAGAALALIASIPLTDDSVIRAWYEVTGQWHGPHLSPVAAVVSLVTWAVVLFVLPRHFSTRWWAIAFAVPAFLILDAASRFAWPRILSF